MSSLGYFHDHTGGASGAPAREYKVKGGALGLMRVKATSAQTAMEIYDQRHRDAGASPRTEKRGVCTLSGRWVWFR